MIEAPRNPAGERLALTFVPGRPDRRDLVVIGHGLTSHRDRPWLVAVSDQLQRRGVASLRVSFAGNGESEGRFEEATIQKEAADLGAVLDAVDAAAPGCRIAYAGHSMGAAVGLLRTVGDDRIQALVSLAGMVHVHAFMERHFGALTPGRDVMLGKPDCPLSQGFLDAARTLGSLVELAPRVQVPWLLVHGTADDIVPLQDAVDAARHAGAGAHLRQLDGVDHRFTDCQAETGALVADWLDRHWAQV
ncbi:MAG: alpha/beta hydrolase [Planctomycetota bacterium]